MAPGGGEDLPLRSAASEEGGRKALAAAAPPSVRCSKNDFDVELLAAFYWATLKCDGLLLPGCWAANRKALWGVINTATAALCPSWKTHPVPGVSAGATKISPRPCHPGRCFYLAEMGVPPLPAWISLESRLLLSKSITWTSPITLKSHMCATRYRSCPICL